MFDLAIWELVVAKYPRGLVESGSIWLLYYSYSQWDHFFPDHAFTFKIVLRPYKIVNVSLLFISLGKRFSAN
ncbi:hypothetical protein Plhal304r1_c038g0114551 [Plasmopara halstedii]